MEFNGHPGGRHDSMNTTHWPDAGRLGGFQVVLTRKRHCIGIRSTYSVYAESIFSASHRQYGEGG